MVLGGGSFGKDVGDPKSLNVEGNGWEAPSKEDKAKETARVFGGEEGRGKLLMWCSESNSEHPHQSSPPEGTPDHSRS